MTRKEGTIEVLNPPSAGFAPGPCTALLRSIKRLMIRGPSVRCGHEGPEEGIDMTESNPTVSEVVEVALSAESGGAVKTLTDLRFEKLEARFSALEKENAELRKANAELYAFAQAKAQAPAPAPAAAQPADQPAVAAAAPVETQAEVQAQAEKQKTEAEILADTLARLGYKKQDDGM